MAVKVDYATMKTKILTVVCLLAFGAANVSSCFAGETPGPGAVVVDVVVARPACLAATVVGSAFFIVALPLAAVSKSVKPTCDALVVKPARATFTRPLGDLDALSD